jgi:hypothetical protein
MPNNRESRWTWTSSNSPHVATGNHLSNFWSDMNAQTEMPVEPVPFAMDVPGAGMDEGVFVPQPEEADNDD